MNHGAEFEYELSTFTYAKLIVEGCYRYKSTWDSCDTVPYGFLGTDTEVWRPMDEEHKI